MRNVGAVLVFGAIAIALLAGPGARAGGQDKIVGRMPEISVKIDDTLRGKWSGARVTPSPAGDDAEFLRRVTLDLTGVIPSEDDVRKFLSDRSETRRGAKIEELLQTDLYADLWSRIFTEVLFGDYNNLNLSPGKNLAGETKTKLVKNFLKYMKDHIAKDTPWPKIVTELLEAQGKATEVPQLLFKVSFYNGESTAPLNFADGMSKSLLGIRVSCARCHNHPFDRWTEEDYYGLAAFFCRTQTKPLEADKDNCKDVEIYEDKEGEMSIPKSGKMVKPTFLFGGQAAKSDPHMLMLSRFMVSRENVQLSRAFINRVWGVLMGRGIVHPVDDFSQKNKPMSPTLLDAISADFSSHGYSLRQVIRGITNSRSYQLACGRDTAVSREDQFSQAPVRPMMAIQLYRSLLMACCGPEMALNRNSDKFKSGWGEFAGQMHIVFGPGNPWTETTPLPGNTRQALFMRNNRAVEDMIHHGGRLSQITSSGEPAEKIDRMFLTVLTRPPTETEKARWMEHVTGKGGVSWEDFMWTLINSAEFVSRH